MNIKQLIYFSKHLKISASIILLAGLLLLFSGTDDAGIGMENDFPSPDAGRLPVTELFNNVDNTNEISGQSVADWEQDIAVGEQSDADEEQSFSDGEQYITDGEQTGTNEQSGTTDNQADSITDTEDLTLPDQPAEDESAQYPEPDKTAYLTFDDGPSHEITTGLLDILKEENITATFFVLPRSKNDFADLYRRILDEGHEIGNHSYSHDYSRLYSNDINEFKNDVAAAQAYIRSLLDYEMKVFRFPGGSRGRAENIINPRYELINDMGLRWFEWNSNAGDATRTPATKDEIIENVLSTAGERKHLIVLFHDSRRKQSTLEAVPEIIEKLREMGYAFDILSNHP